jgi:hypothetical protein
MKDSNYFFLTPQYAAHVVIEIVFNRLSWVLNVKVEKSETTCWGLANIWLGK